MLNKLWSWWIVWSWQGKPQLKWIRSWTPENGSTLVAQNCYFHRYVTLTQHRPHWCMALSSSKMMVIYIIKLMHPLCQGQGSWTIKWLVAASYKNVLQWGPEFLYTAEESSPLILQNLHYFKQMLLWHKYEILSYCITEESSPWILQNFTLF